MNELVDRDLTALKTLIDQMLSDVKSTNIVETPVVMDFLLAARIIVARLGDLLAEPAVV